MAFHSVSRWHRAKAGRNDTGISEVRSKLERTVAEFQTPDFMPDSLLK